MANNWHVNPTTGNPGRCRVDWSNPNARGCPHGLGQGEHFGSAIDAVEHYSQQRESAGDLLPTAVLAAQDELVELRDRAPMDPPPAEESQFVSPEVGEKSFWGRNGKKIGGAVVAAFVLSTVTSLVVGGGEPIDSADAVAPKGDSAVSQEVQEDYEEPLPPQEEATGPTAGELGEEVGDKLRETGERIGDEITPERIEQVKDAGRSIKDFINGIIGGSGLGGEPTIPVPVPIEISEGVQFQGQSIQPSEAEIAQAEATLAELQVQPENTDYEYDRVAQFGRSFETGVVGRLEHRDIPQATFKNDAPQARAIGGGFVDPYTGEYVEIVKGSSSDTDVDHIVPLHEVVQSENPNSPLSASDRISIANDFDNLQVAGSSINRSKGDKDPGEWMPPNRASHLRYAIATINVKAKYGLTVDRAEHDVLASVLAARQ